MSLLDFARGPALEVAFAVFLFGVLWRLVSLLLLPAAAERSVARPGAPSSFGAAVSGFMRHMWPASPYARLSVFPLVNGYVFHIGLALVAFGFAQHIQFVKSLTGLSWPALPAGVVSTVAVITLASLLAALVRRLTSPVLKLISTANDYFTWLVTMLPVVTGLVAFNHFWEPYETLLALHILSVALLLIWFPFGKLMHAFLVFLTRGATGIFYGRRGVKI
jgi:nitrate reductase gamma subunit